VRVQRFDLEVSIVNQPSKYDHTIAMPALNEEH
jgi:hypothetical protein